jgi:hypothetical protein
MSSSSAAAASAGAPPAAPPGWVLQRSTRTGRKYWFHEAQKASVWYDDALPEGWGWVMDGPDSPKWFVELATGKRQAEPPTAPSLALVRARMQAALAASGGSGAAATTAPAAADADDGDGQPSAKRARTEPVAVAAPAAPAAAPASAPAPAPAVPPAQPQYNNPGAVPGRRPAVFPRLAATDFALGKPDSRPACARAISTAWFGDAHARLLRQLVDAVVRSAVGREKQMVSFHREAAEPSPVVIFDVGCGTGAATEFFMGALERATAAAADAAALPSAIPYGECAERESGACVCLPGARHGHDLLT